MTMSAPSHFYTIDGGIQQGPVLNHKVLKNDPTVYATQLKEVLLDPQDWKKQRQPKVWRDAKWPPESAADLLHANEASWTYCSWCRTEDTKPCDCRIEDFRQWNDNWQDNVYLRNVPGGPGTGLFTHHMIPKDTDLGEIMGKLVPRNKWVSSIYTIEVPIGDMSWNGKSHPRDRTAILDSSSQGCVFRFMNHSCDPNCEQVFARIGSTRVLLVRALRDIQADEELTCEWAPNQTKAQTKSQKNLKRRSIKYHCRNATCKGCKGVKPVAGTIPPPPLPPMPVASEAEASPPPSPSPPPPEVSPPPPLPSPSPLPPPPSMPNVASESGAAPPDAGAPPPSDPPPASRKRRCISPEVEEGAEGTVQLARTPTYPWFSPARRSPTKRRRLPGHHPRACSGSWCARRSAAAPRGRP
ncbi:SET domain-containing protein [Polyplosphaeria fusca]|uniref:SET domain-containing protein n=1 Tax=Polyplosphaeria fusca TaxID=682080 RepID=A0A9P4V5E9_9PLEO|nr:SET domain-containing protein [Polyplosphaeria fusca]